MNLVLAATALELNTFSQIEIELGIADFTVLIPHAARRTNSNGLIIYFLHCTRLHIRDFAWF